MNLIFISIFHFLDSITILLRIEMMYGNEKHFNSLKTQISINKNAKRYGPDEKYLLYE